MRALFSYLESLTIGQGREAGQRLQLYPWQKKFLRGAFGQPDDAALSFARGGGKTTFTAGIAYAALNGQRSVPEPPDRTALEAFRRPPRNLAARAHDRPRRSCRTGQDPAPSAKT